MREDFDLVVVGAGPGGSNAAAAALGGGLSVAQIDKAPFPRVKPCAGALTVRACRALQFELDPSLRGASESFEFNLWGEDRGILHHRTRLLSMVLRPEFDNRLVRENLSRPGFAFFDGEALKDVVFQDGRFVLRTPRRTLRAPQLVGADGAYSRVNAVFGVSRPRARAVAVEVNPLRAEVDGDPPERPVFDFGAVERGYGWVFPKTDQLSVGLYTLERGQKDLRERLRGYLGAKGLRVRGDPLAGFEAHLIPVGGYRLRVPDVPVYVVGDAGGFADALTGEGIYHALESGRLAGETAVAVARGAATHRRYYRRLWPRVLADTFLSYHLARPFYRRLSRSLRWLASPLVWRPLVHGYGRGATLSGCVALGGVYLAGSLLERTVGRTAG